MLPHQFAMLSPTDQHTFQVGMLTKLWATTELMLDIAASVVFTHLNDHARNKDMPKNLSDKLSMTRRSLVNNQDHVPSLRSCIEVIDCTVNSVDFRHKCVHGVALHDGDKFIIQFFERLPKTIEHRVKNVTRDDLNDAFAQVAFLITAWSYVVPMVCDLAKIRLPQQLSVSPVPHPDPRPNATKIETRLLQAISEMSDARSKLGE